MPLSDYHVARLGEKAARTRSLERLLQQGYRLARGFSGEHQVWALCSEDGTYLTVIANGAAKWLMYKGLIVKRERAAANVGPIRAVVWWSLSYSAPSPSA